MRLPWPFGKKQAAVGRMQAREEMQARYQMPALREDAAISLDPYTMHITAAKALLEPIGADLPTFPGALNDDTRGTIERRVESELPALRPVLTDLHGAEPHQVVQNAHQELLAGLQLAVAGQGQIQQALHIQAQEQAASDYRCGLTAMTEGVTMASAALARIDIILLNRRNRR